MAPPAALLRERCPQGPKRTRDRVGNSPVSGHRTVARRLGTAKFEEASPVGCPFGTVGRLLKDQRIICDGCGAPIAELTQPPAEDWAALHNLCSRCFAERSKIAI